MVFTDPPYNLPIKGHVSGLGKIKHGDFAMASGELSSAEFQDFSEDLARACCALFIQWCGAFRLL